MNFSAVILAGGQSSRMGRDKARLAYQGQTLLARQIDLVRKLGAEEVLVSGRTPGDYPECGARVIADRFSQAGPLAGIHSALMLTRSPLLLVLAVDLPQISAPVLEKLLAHCTETCGAAPSVGGRLEPLAAWYPQASLALAEQLLGSERPAPGASALVQRCRQEGLMRLVPFSPEAGGLFRSWNCPADVPPSGTGH